MPRSLPSCPRRNATRRLLPALAGLGLVFSAFAAPLPASPEQTLTSLLERPPAPELGLPDLDGAMHTLAKHEGKVLIVNFWATWCPPCRAEMPSMQRAWEVVKDDGIVLLGVNMGEDEDRIWTFTADYPVDFPLLLDRDGSVTERWPLKGLPTTFVVDGEGRLVYQAIGERAWDDPVLLDKVRALRTEPATDAATGPGPRKD